MEPPAAAPTAAARAQIDEKPEHDDEILPPTHPHQVGGHAGLTNEGGALLVAEPGRLAKPVGHGYFAGEDAFYEQLRPDDALAPFVPAFFGTRCIRGRTCVVLEDVTHGMRAPCIVDIKIGTSTVAPDAGWEKRLSHLRKDRATTTRPLGLRLIGAQTVGAAGGAPFERRGKPWGKALRPEEVAAALRSCFSVGGVLRAAAVAHFVGRLQRLLHGLETAPSRQLLGSSILCVYDGAEPAADGAATPPPALRVIDFAHAYPLRATRAPLPRNLAPETAAASCKDEAVAGGAIGESEFRLAMNADVCATTKLAEGINAFVAETLKLEAALKAKMSA